MEVSRFAYSLADTTGSRVEYVCGLRVRGYLELTMWTSIGADEPFESTMRIAKDEGCIMSQLGGFDCHHGNHTITFLVNEHMFPTEEDDEAEEKLKNSLNMVVRELQHRVAEHVELAERTFKMEEIINCGSLISERIGGMYPSITEFFEMETEIARSEIEGDGDGTIGFDFHC